jgi:hypothetical protein
MKTWYLTKKTDPDGGNNLTTQDGHIKMVTDIEALRVRIDAALQVVKGEVSDPNFGVDYFGVIMSNTPLNIKIQEIARVVNNLEGVESLQFNRAEVDRTTGTLDMFFTIKSVYGDIEYNKTFEKLA